MNKLVKGAVAGAAGVALLLGGAGTFALWNSSIGVASGAVATGTLSFSPSSTGVWTDTSPGAATTTFLPASQAMVPGDVVSLTQNITVNATGKNLRASLAYTPSSVAIPTDLVTKLIPTVTLTKVSGGDATVTGSGPFLIAPVSGGSTVFTVTITFTFNGTTTTGVVGQAEAIDLSGASFTLTQIHS